MSVINRAALVALLESKILSGGKRTTAANLRQVNTALIESLVALIDDKNVNGGYLGIDEDTGKVDSSFIDFPSPPPTGTPCFTGSDSQGMGIAITFSINLPAAAVAYLAANPTNYKVIVIPTNADSAAFRFYISNKQPNHFELTYTSVPGGTTLEVDFVIIPDN